MQTAYKQPYLDQRLTPGNGSWHAHTMFMFIIYFHSGLQMLPKGSNKAFHKFLVLVNLLTAPSFPPLVSLQYPLNLLSFIIPHLLSFHKCPTIHLHIYFLQVKSWYSRPAYIFSYVLCVSPHFTRWFPQQSQVFPLISLSGPPVLQLTIFNLLSLSLNTFYHKRPFSNFLFGPGVQTEVLRLCILAFKWWAISSILSLSFLYNLPHSSNRSLFSSWFLGYTTDINIFFQEYTKQLHSEMQWGNMFSYHSFVI